MDKWQWIGRCRLLLVYTENVTDEESILWWWYTYNEIEKKNFGRIFLGNVIHSRRVATTGDVASVEMTHCEQQQQNISFFYVSLRFRLLLLLFRCFRIRHMGLRVIVACGTGFQPAKWGRLYNRHTHNTHTHTVLGEWSNKLLPITYYLLNKYYVYGIFMYIKENKWMLMCDGNSCRNDWGDNFR